MLYRMLERGGCQIRVCVARGAGHGRRGFMFYG